MPKLRELREKLGLTQAELAACAGVEQWYISAIEIGRIGNPGFVSGLRLAMALGVEPKELAPPDALLGVRVATGVATN